MADINQALASSKAAIEHLLATGEQTAARWTTPPAPGRWSPSQIAEHVARSLEESANAAAGLPAKFPKLPAIIHPVVRGFLFKRVLKTEAFPRAKTNKAMNPDVGPATLAEARARLEGAHTRFADACRQLASRGQRIRTTMFGAVGVEDYVRFMELHTRHHTRQIVNG